MARKSWMYSVLEAVQHEMREDPNMLWIFELTPPVASNPGKPVINLEKEFGRGRVVNTGIDENWMVSATLGAGLAGSRAATYVPYQGACMPFQVIQNHAGKLRSMTGGKASMPVVFVMEMTGQTPGFAGQHSDYEIDTYYAHIPGVKTVIPSTPYDAKGMMVSALRDPNPVVYLYPAGLRELIEDVPDEQYEVPLDKAIVRQEGSDLTIVSSGAGMPDVMKAADILFTFHLILLSWIFFRASSIEQAMVVISRIWNALPSLPALLPNYPFTGSHLTGGILIGLLLVIEILDERRPILDRLAHMPRVLRWSAIYGGIFSLVLIGRWQSEQFIYMQF